MSRSNKMKENHGSLDDADYCSKKDKTRKRAVILVTSACLWTSFSSSWQFTSRNFLSHLIGELLIRKKERWSIRWARRPVPWFPVYRSQRRARFPVIPLHPSSRRDHKLGVTVRRWQDRKYSSQDFPCFLHVSRQVSYRSREWCKNQQESWAELRERHRHTCPDLQPNIRGTLRGQDMKQRCLSISGSWKEIKKRAAMSLEHIAAHNNEEFNAA